jgi:para-aminobenzoate synthetase component 1
MELIEKYEKSKRGIFSGALGYTSPLNPLSPSLRAERSKWRGEGGEVNFDFNVVIRSIMYNASEKYLSFMAGSGVTFYSDAEKEYEECLLKAQAMRGVLE